MTRTVEEHRRLRKEIRAELDALEAKDATLPWKTTRAEELLKLHTDSVNRDRPEREFLGWRRRFHPRHATLRLHVRHWE